MQNKHFITRRIEIDAGHRIPDHGSKCKNLHGHRYVIEATCEGPLFSEGEQKGMVIDFGFLKDEMVAQIDTPCDHGFILYINDPYIVKFLDKDVEERTRSQLKKYPDGFGCEVTNAWGKFYFMSDVPTAENLAKHWFNVLEPRVRERTEHQAHLVNVRVHETPNCHADYPGV